MRYFLLLTGILVLLNSSVLAQEPTNYFSARDEMNFTDSNVLYLNFRNTNFLWNNEFFNDVVEGYTLIGYHITPTLQYHFNSNFLVETGIHLLQYSGLNKYTDFAPVYRVRYKKDNFAFIMGSLYGTINHNLPEPIYFFERFFTDNLESGLQAIWDTDRMKLDIWLDWRNFIFENDSTQEKLTAGISMETFLLKNKQWELSVPASLLLNHRGGQIDTSSANMLTAMNYGLGLSVNRKIDNPFLSGINATVHYLGFVDNSPNIENIYDKGTGFLADLTLRSKNLGLKLGYWEGEEFLSLHGHPIYQCYSYKGNDYHKDNRSLITGRLFYSKELYKGIYFGIQGECFYDTDNGDIDFTTGIALHLKQNFFLLNVK